VWTYGWTWIMQDYPVDGAAAARRALPGEQARSALWSASES
jgi:hypothetical protein